MESTSLTSSLTLIATLVEAAENHLSTDVNERILTEHLHGADLPTDAGIARLADRIIDAAEKLCTLLEPSHLILADHFLGYVSTKCLVGAVESGVPDVLAQAPCSLQQLAQATATHEQRLRQVMRLLCSNGVFSFDEDTAMYSNNPRSDLLRKDSSAPWRHWVDLYGNEFYDIARGISQSLQRSTTRSAAQCNFNTDEDMFAYFERQGWVPRLHRTLASGMEAMAPGVVADYPWAEVADRTVMDLGGGGGALIATLLRAFPGMRGGILDLAGVIDHTRPFFREGGPYVDLAGRVSDQDLQVGDFLQQVPSYEVYTIKWCLHDWEDEQAVQILRNVRSAIVRTETSRLVILEAVLRGEGRSARLARYGDINMMMTAKGRERTEGEWQGLYTTDYLQSWVHLLECLEIYSSGPEFIVGQDPSVLFAAMTSVDMRAVTQAGDPDGQDNETIGRLVLYVIKADQTSYINYIKPIILAEELKVDYTMSIIDTKTEWAYRIHPERMVPALRDYDLATGQVARVFESTACLYYLAEKFDTDGTWTGRGPAERAQVHSWMALQTAGLGPTAKFWLYFLRGYPTRESPVQLPRTIDKFREATMKQWDLLDARLSQPEHLYIALPGRPTLADVAFLPFAMPAIFEIFGIDISRWPKIAAWSTRMMERPAVKKVLDMAPNIGQ
ncbi:hypothetical protein TI39_contig4213g00002 [Zymoseptoria brevis]|uniref:O-methyltransferase like protein n=1 Tax=Zymoseptoria brevis TaxID=1047168 RepID=A0A0F4G9W4_9PEZI|nr:hypothetical protein TI39_contig4213g00002 [Zymoseptoria brevis]